MQERKYTYNSEKENTVFAVKLRGLFENRKKAHRELAEHIEKVTGESVTRQAVGQWCNGNTCPNLKIVPVIAAFFGVSTDFLLTDTEIETPNAEEIAVCKFTGLSLHAVLTLSDCFSQGNNPKASEVASKLIETGLFIDMISELTALKQESEACFKSYGFMLNESTEKREVIQKIADLLQVDYMTVKRHLSSIPVKSAFVKQENAVTQDGSPVSHMLYPANVSCNLHRYSVTQLCEKASDLFDHRKDFLSYSRAELLEYLGITEQQLKNLQNETEKEAKKWQEQPHVKTNKAK